MNIYVFNKDEKEREREREREREKEFYIQFKIVSKHIPFTLIISF